MSASHDEADYLSPAPRGARRRPAWQRLGLPVAAIFLVAGGGAAAIGVSTQEVYEAEAQVELMTPEGLPTDATLPEPAERIVAARSSPVASQAVAQLGLLEDPRFLAAHPALDASGVADADRQAQAASIVLANTGTQVNEGGSLAGITYRSTDPVLAAAIANALAQAFLPVDARSVADAADNSSEELEALVEEIRTELEEAERALAEGLSEADIVALPDPEAGLVPLDGNDAFSAEARRTLETQLGLVQARLAAVEAAIAGGALDPSDPVIARLQESRAELDEEYQRITQQFRADYPAALDLREQIDVIDATLARERVRKAEERVADAQQLRIQETDLRAQIAALGDEVDQRASSGEGLDALQRDVLEKRELYNLLLQRLAAAQEGRLPTTARIIAAAQAPTRPVVPDWRLLIGGAMGIALLLSTMLVVADRHRRRSAY